MIIGPLLTYKSNITLESSVTLHCEFENDSALMFPIGGEGIEVYIRFKELHIKIYA